MSLPEGFTLRPASIADLDTLVSHRRKMFRDMGYKQDATMESMSSRFRAWLLEQMNAGHYHAWLICAADGSIAAGTGLWLMDWPPHVIGKGSRRGNILNVYTSQSFRRRGLARHLVQTALDWCRENQIDTVILHASAAGQGLYQSMGFQPTNEMRLGL
jgi:ribosomal protein S18 acetylase RimI-like enzyme